MMRRFITGVSLAWLLATMAALAAGVAEEKYDNGKIKFRCPLDKNGNKHGTYDEYGEDGKLKVRDVQQRQTQRHPQSV